MLYFHGTKKAAIERIVNDGLSIIDGRATFSTNPEMTLPYSGIGGGIFVYKDDGCFRVAKDSDIKFDEQKREIVGWINRYKNEQHGYYPINSETEVPRELLVGAFTLTQGQHDLLKRIKFLLRDGKLKKSDIAGFVERYEKLLSVKTEQIIKPKIVLAELCEQAIQGLVRNLSLLQVRTLELSHYANSGWKIKNLGDHEVRLYDADVFDHYLHAVRDMINARLLTDDIAGEFEATSKRLNFKNTN
ncbi:MAG: hypothetical protein WC080_04325 [Patescibacteria group bacterium]